MYMYMYEKVSNKLEFKKYHTCRRARIKFKLIRFYFGNIKKNFAKASCSIYIYMYVVQTAIYMIFSAHSRISMFKSWSSVDLVQQVQ